MKASQDTWLSAGTLCRGVHFERLSGQRQSQIDRLHLAISLGPSVEFHPAKPVFEKKEEQMKFQGWAGVYFRHLKNRRQVFQTEGGSFSRMSHHEFSVTSGLEWGQSNLVTMAW